MISAQVQNDLKKYIRDIADFPKAGILFRDITPLLRDKKALKLMIDSFVKALKGMEIDYIVAAEARGFILGGMLSYALNCGFIPVRKPGKLPYKTFKHTYSLEYGEDSLEMHQDSFPKNSKILILDDVLATGGTMLAMINLVNKLKGNIVGISFLIELTALNGREKFKDYPIISLVKY